MTALQSSPLDGRPEEARHPNICLNVPAVGGHSESGTGGHDPPHQPTTSTCVYSRYLTQPVRWLRPSAPTSNASESHGSTRTDGSAANALNLEAVYAAHRDALWSFALRLLADRAAAEDLVHDVFVSLPKVWHKVQPETPLRSFLLGVTANLARNYTRSTRRRNRLADLWSREAPVATAEHPERLAVRRNLAQRLEHALSQLSHDHRVVFVLVEIEQHTPLEVAEILNLPPGTVRSRLFHAKRQLQAQLSNDSEAS